MGNGLKCKVCGGDLEGRQTKYCSPKCQRINKRPYHVRYMRNYNNAKRVPRYCVVCGKQLKGRQRKFCSVECRNKNKRYNQFEIDMESVMPEKVPNFDNKCEECQGQVIKVDEEYFCKKCGLVI